MRFQIKVKGDAKLKGMTENGVVFDDGSQVEADVVVACTGFDLDVLGEVTKIVGPEIGKNLDHYWGIDSEGELRGAYKPLSCECIPLRCHNLYRIDTDSLS